MCNFKRNFLKCCVPWLRHEPLGAMTAVSYCKLIPRVPGANISEVPNSAEEFSHSAGGPQLELGWGPGRAKRARAPQQNTGICISRIRPFCGGVNLQNWASSWFLLKWVRCQCDVSVENKFSKKPPHSASGTRPGAPSRIFQNTPKPPLFAQSGRKLFNTKKIGNFLQAESPSPLSW